MDEYRRSINSGRPRVLAEDAIALLKQWGNWRVTHAGVTDEDMIPHNIKITERAVASLRLDLAQVIDSRFVKRLRDFEAAEANHMSISKYYSQLNIAVAYIAGDLGLSL